LPEVHSRPASTRRKRWGSDAVDRVGGQVSNYRKERNLTIAQLARAVGVTPSLIGQIERGQTHPSIVTLYSLAEALDVPVGALAARDDLGGGPIVVRPSDRALVESADGIRSERLVSVPASHVQFLEVTYSPGAESSAELERHPGVVEMTLVVRGQIDVLIEFDCYALNEGDSIQFASTLAHRYVNASGESARAIMVILLPGSDRRADPAYGISGH
jgi:transcriptional regulator with XRE-family HTH domain